MDGLPGHFTEKFRAPLERLPRTADHPDHLTLPRLRAAAGDRRVEIEDSALCQFPRTLDGRVRVARGRVQNDLSSPQMPGAFREQRAHFVIVRQAQQHHIAGVQHRMGIGLHAAAQRCRTTRIGIKSAHRESLLT